MFFSIKKRIILFYTIILLIFLSILSIILYIGLKNIVFNSVDAKLLSKAHALAIIIDTYNDEIHNEKEFKSILSNKILREYNFPQDKDFFFQIRSFNKEGATIKKSFSLEDIELPFSFYGQTKFETIFFNGQITRKVDLYIPARVENGRKEDGVIIQCAEVIQKDLNILRQFKLILLISVLFILISSTFGANIIAGKALLPINNMSETISNVSEANLSERINLRNIPPELKKIASSFNHTMDLLEKSFIRQKEFIADASHELRTPIATIMSQSEITLRKERSSQDYKEALLSIMNATKIMSDIIQKLLILARLSADKIELDKHKIYIDDVLCEAISLLTPLTLRKEINLTTNFSGEFEIYGNRETLLELFVNIIDNSIKYNNNCGKIDISIKEEHTWIITEIIDTGIGIHEEDLHKVFDRFYRVDKSRSKELGGTGLGLSICNEIVRLHNGKIILNSKPGMGTSVKVYLKKSNLL